MRWLTKSHAHVVAGVGVISAMPSSMLSIMVARIERVRSISAVRSCTSLNSRTVSIAITAWSAKVEISSICLALNGRAASRVSVMTPIGTPSRSSGTPSMARKLPTLLASGQWYSVSAATSGMWMMRRSSAVRPTSGVAARRDLPGRA